MAQKETPRQDPAPDIMFIFPAERPYGCNGYIWTSDRPDALRGLPCGERISRLDKSAEITWQTLQDARQLDQERFKNFLEKSDEFDKKLDRVSDEIDAKFDLLRKTLIIGFISLGGIGVAGAAIIVALIIFLFGGK